MPTFFFAFGAGGAEWRREVSEAPHLSWTRTYTDCTGANGRLLLPTQCLTLESGSIVRSIVPLDGDLHAHAAVGGMETCAIIARSLVLSEI